MDGILPSKKILVVVDDFFIADAMENYASANDSVSYLDIHTGEVVMLSTKVVNIVESGDLVAAETLPVWQKDELEIARNVFADESDRFIAIPGLESYESFQFMEEFVDQLSDNQVANLLAKALRGFRPFRRFKDVLGEFYEIDQQWYSFKNQKMRKKVADFLASIENSQIELVLQSK